MSEKYKKLLFNTGVALCLTFGGISSVYANEPIKEPIGFVQEYKVANNSLDGLGGVENEQPVTNNNPSPTQTDQDNRNSASAVGDLFQNAGIDNESTSQANTFLEPLARGINIVSAFVLGLTSLAIFLVTAFDLLYIGFPPARGMLNPQSQGGGMGGYGGGQQSNNGVRWVSDEAIACVSNDSAGVGGMGSPMGGMGSPMGGGSTGGAKSMVMSYLKKRTVFLVVFAICVILFTSTVFTDLGLKLGMLILSWITGMSGSIPV